VRTEATSWTGSQPDRSGKQLGGSENGQNAFPHKLGQGRQVTTPSEPRLGSKDTRSIIV